MTKIEYYQKRINKLQKALDDVDILYDTEKYLQISDEIDKIILNYNVVPSKCECDKDLGAHILFKFGVDNLVEPWRKGYFIKQNNDGSYLVCYIEDGNTKFSIVKQCQYE